jgi:3-oxoacyl-[acyl-carrier protein] reductase
MGRLDGKVAIVTAAAGAGIGQATAKKLAQEGANVVVSDAHKREDGTSRTTEVADEITKATGKKSIGVVCDVTKPEQVNAMVERTVKEFGRVDIIVNNAGFNKLSRLEKMEDDNWERVLAITFHGAYYGIKAVLPHMVKQKWGRIVTISSFEGWSGSPFGEVHYAASKAGVMGLTRAVAREVAPHGITANAVAPGATMNPFLAKQYTKQMLDMMERLSPIGRSGRPPDIANAVAFLASPEAEYITGEILLVAGAQYIR